MWEIIQRHLDGCSLWQGRDAEGRTVYAVTTDMADHTPVEPTGARVYRSRKAAIHARYQS